MIRYQSLWVHNPTIIAGVCCFGFGFIPLPEMHPVLEEIGGDDIDKGMVAM